MFRSRARTFWFAARFLPADRRAAVAGLYAFARTVDDLVDAPPPALTGAYVACQLAAWRAWLEYPTRLAAPDPRLAARVSPVLLTYGVPPRYLQMLIDGVGSDLRRCEMRSWPELRAYCVQVASSVGLAMCHLLAAGCDPIARAAAVDLGIAMQLTNILRDVGADLEDGRVYLAQDELAAHGYSRERLVWLAAHVRLHGAGAIDRYFAGPNGRADRTRSGALHARTRGHRAPATREPTGDLARGTSVPRDPRRHHCRQL